MSAIEWLALRIGYAVIAGVMGCVLIGAVLVAWYAVPKPRVVRWRS